MVLEQCVCACVSHGVLLNSIDLVVFRTAVMKPPADGLLVDRHATDEPPLLKIKKNAYSATDISLRSADKFLIQVVLLTSAKLHTAQTEVVNTLSAQVLQHTHWGRCSLWLYPNPSFRDFLVRINSTWDPHTAVRPSAPSTVKCVPLNIPPCLYFEEGAAPKQ